MKVRSKLGHVIAINRNVAVAIAVELTQGRREYADLESRIDGRRQSHEVLTVPAPGEVEYIDEVARHCSIEQGQQLARSQLLGSEGGPEIDIVGGMSGGESSARSMMSWSWPLTRRRTKVSDACTASTDHRLSLAARANASNAFDTSPARDVKASRSSVGRVVRPWAASARPRPRETSRPRAGQRRRGRPLPEIA